MASNEPIVIDLERDVIAVAVGLAMQRIRVGLSALVRSVAREPGRVDVDLGARYLATNLTPQEESPAPDLPVITPRGDGYGLYFDVAPGDLGVALCCDRPVRGLYETGAVTTPQRVGGHDYGCAVFLPGGRVSSSTTPTPPPNAAGTLKLGADDGSAGIELRRAGGPSPEELGSVVVTAAGPSASVLLGGAGATLGVVRLGDDVAATPAFLTWIAQVTAAINTLAPGAVTPFVGPVVGTASSASVKVVAE